VRLQTIDWIRDRVGSNASPYTDIVKQLYIHRVSANFICPDCITPYDRTDDRYAGIAVSPRAAHVKEAAL